MLEVFSYELKNWKRAHIELLVGEKNHHKEAAKDDLFSTDFNVALWAVMRL